MTEQERAERERWSRHFEAELSAAVTLLYCPSCDCHHAFGKHVSAKVAAGRHAANRAWSNDDWDSPMELN